MLIVEHFKGYIAKKVTSDFDLSVLRYYPVDPLTMPQPYQILIQKFLGLVCKNYMENQFWHIPIQSIGDRFWIWRKWLTG